MRPLTRRFRRNDTSLPTKGRGLALASAPQTYPRAARRGYARAMNPDWPKTENASARDARWMAHVLACPHEKCRAARRCRMRWTSARRCPARNSAPPSEREAAALLTRVNLELHRIAFEEDDAVAHGAGRRSRTPKADRGGVGAGAQADLGAIAASCRALGARRSTTREGHHDIIRRFSRSRHCNAISGETMREEQQRYFG